MAKALVKAFLDRRVNQHVEKALSLSTEFSDLRAIEHTASAVAELAKSRGFSKKQIFELFYAINRTLYPEFVINDRGRLLLADDAFRACFARFSNDNWTSFERKWNVKEMLRLLHDVPGALAECGVYKGGNAFLMCEFAEKQGRRVHLFDSFQGLSRPGEADGNHWSEGNLSASEEVVHENLKQFSCFETFKGWIPEAFPAVSDQRYAFLHIDVDLKQPTYDSIAFFYPRMNRGGIIILDDHGYDTCPGAREAVLEYMVDKPEPVLDLSTGQGMILKQ